MIEDDDEESGPGQVTEAVRQVKKATEGEKLGPEGDVDLDTEESQTTKASEQEEDSVPDEQPEDSMFIPCGWPRERPREFYKASDPEWQSFMEFARDDQRKRSVKSSSSSYHLDAIKRRLISSCRGPCTCDRQ